ncbi:hypothetical protein HYT51_00415 [Candidatus Woesearchaeota archaeon]|nr:hypothetical protein [Candidatus Woesearchaeota archaeon]
MNKKGIFIVGLAVITLFIVGIALFVFYTSEKKSDRAVFGEIQLDVIETYNAGERALFYLDRSAKYAADESLNQFYQESECGKYQEYSLWKYGSKDCFPDFAKLYNISFNKNLDAFLSSYSEAKFPISNYEVSIENGFVNGKAIEKIEINKNNVAYQISPDFKVKADFDLDSFIEVSEKAKGISNECRDNFNCWKSKIEPSWEIKEEGKIFMLSVPVQLENKEEIIRFALNFNPLVR